MEQSALARSRGRLSPQKLRKRYPRRKNVISRRILALSAGEGVKGVTKDRYDRAFESFKETVREVKGVELSKENVRDIVDERMLVCYVGYESMFMSYDSLCSKISGVKHRMKLLYNYDPWENKKGFYKYQRVMDEINLQDNSRIGKKKVKFAVSKPVLNGVVGRMDCSCVENLAKRALYCVGVACLMRWSELGIDKREVGKDKLLTMNHLSLYRKGEDVRGVIAIPDPKTLRHNAEQTAEFHADGSKSCPVSALMAYLATLPAGRKKKHMPLFQDKNGDALTLADVKTTMKRLLIEVGANLAQSRGISLRRGGALSLALAGTPDRVIQEMGRWSSNAYRLYIDTTTEERKRWLRRVGNIEYGGKNEKPAIRSETVKAGRGKKECNKPPGWAEKLRPPIVGSADAGDDRGERLAIGCDEGEQSESSEWARKLGPPTTKEWWAQERPARIFEPQFSSVDFGVD